MKNFNKQFVMVAFAIIFMLGSAFTYAKPFTETPPEEQPQILLPENGQLVSSLTPILSWGEVSGAEFYNIMLSHYEGENIVINVLTTQNKFWTNPELTVMVAEGILDYRTPYFWKVQACNSVGNGPWSDISNFVTYDPTLGTDNLFNKNKASENLSVKEFKLNKNYPNPFNPTTKISYEIPISSFVKITVYNILGKEVKTLVDSYQNAGVHTIEFNASSLSSGIYICRMQSNGFVSTSKMNLIK